MKTVIITDIATNPIEKNTKIWYNNAFVYHDFSSLISGYTRSILGHTGQERRTTDAKGRTVDFKNTIIVATSNVGSHTILDFTKSEIRKKGEWENLKKEINNMLKQHFRPEFLNRIDDMIIFHPLEKFHIEEIVKLQLDRVKRMLEAQKISVEFDKSLVEFLADHGYDAEFGARPIKRIIQKSVESELSNEILKGNVNEGDTIKVKAEDGKVVVNKS